MRDDGLGPSVVEALSDVGLPPGVAVVDGGTGGLDLLELMEGAERVIFVDAVNFGGEPGEIAVFAPDEARRLDLGPIASLHSIGLLDVLELGKALEIKLPEVTIVGVQPEIVATGLGLSSALQAKLPEVVKTVRDVLARNLS